MHSWSLVASLQVHMLTCSGKHILTQAPATTLARTFATKPFAEPAIYISLSQGTHSVNALGQTSGCLATH
jgi:hypothetical protein